ncbi:MAG: radical SAM protein [Armatimonadetes bacterium]|nr:radical SAM protein [Armatimonadota bacterium]
MDNGLLLQVEPSVPKGIARLAMQAPCLEDCREAAYYQIPARSVLSRCNSPRVAFLWTINPYRGCAFGCVYCYARYTHEYFVANYRHRPRDPSYETIPATVMDFERRIYAKVGAAQVLAAELQRRDVRGQQIAVGTVTDPYQPAERRYRITRSLLAVLARHQGLVLSLTTKSDLVTRDLDLLRRIAANSHLHVNITVTTLDHTLARRLEPRAPRPDRRLAAVRRLVEGGIHTGVFVMPILPGLNDGAASLDALVAAAAAAGARYVATQPLCLRDATRARFYPWLRQEFPHLYARYRRLYARDTDLPAGEADRLRDLFDYLRRKHGLAGGRESRLASLPHAPDQPALGL